MTEPNSWHDATYHDDFDFTVERSAITDAMMFRYFELKRERTIADLRALDRLLGREQTIPKRVR